MAERISRILRYPAEFHRLAEGGRTSVEADFSQKTQIAALEGGYREILG